MRLQRQSNKQIITLDVTSALGHGGEARVYAVPQAESLVAKVYHKPTKAHAHKLVAMLANPPENPTAGKGHISIAWPVDLLRAVDGSERLVGFLMPRVKEMHSMLDFYNPKTRRQKCPFFNYLYLHRTARNLAAAVGALHARGYCVGDVNESNILVGNTALVTLVDTDSFQVRDPHNGVVYRCPVGKSEFTPPELQGKNFAQIERKTEHDLFGLAVLIFQLLMEGTHPFSGIFQGTGDPPPSEARIAAGHFTYSSGQKVPYIPTPIAPPFEILHPTLRQLFVRCFEKGHKNPKMRPSIQTWQAALKEAEDALVTCSTNKRHLYGNHLNACPWCERAVKLGGRDPFPSDQVVKEGLHLQPIKRQRATIPQRSERLIAPSKLTLPTQTPLSNKVSPKKTKKSLIPLILGLSGAGILVFLEAMVLLKDLKLAPETSANLFSSNQSAASNSITNSNNVSVAYYDQGNFYYKLGNYKGAIENFNQALELNPKDAKAYLNRGNAHYEVAKYSGDNDTGYGKAIEDFNQALRLNPQETEAYFKRGVVRYENAKYSKDPVQEYKAAIADFNQTLRLNPKDARVYVRRGLVRSKLAEYRGFNGIGYGKAAIEDFNQALRLNPNEARAYFRRGLVQYEIAKYSADSNKTSWRAVEDLQQAAKLFLVQGDIEEYQKAQTKLCDVLKELGKSCDSFPLKPENMKP